jgi:FkbM family methyltransferase
MSLYKTLKFIVKHPLNNGKKIIALLEYMKWQIGSRLVPGDVIYHWVNDSKFIARVGERGVTQNIYCGLHEFHEMAYVLHVLNSQDIFIDIGANAGSYTILACAVSGAMGFCFEPIPSTYQRLVSNIKLNDLSDRVKSYNMGLADKEGDLLFTSTLDTINHVVIENEQTIDAISVKVFPLDTVLAGVSPSLIKIDVEGLETRVINGMLRTLENPSLHSIIMELNGSGGRYGFTDDAIIKKMLDFGFRMYRYEPFDRKLKLVLKNRENLGNVLFLRNEEFINHRIANAPRVKVGSLEI